jgi:hypothetical protein
VNPTSGNGGWSPRDPRPQPHHRQPPLISSLLIYLWIPPQELISSPAFKISLWIPPQETEAGAQGTRALSPSTSNLLHWSQVLRLLDPEQWQRGWRGGQGRSWPDGDGQGGRRLSATRQTRPFRHCRDIRMRLSLVGIFFSRLFNCLFAFIQSYCTVYNVDVSGKQLAYICYYFYSIDDPRPRAYTGIISFF